MLVGIFRSRPCVHGFDQVYGVNPEWVAVGHGRNGDNHTQAARSVLVALFRLEPLQTCVAALSR